MNQIARAEAGKEAPKTSWKIACRDSTLRPLRADNTWTLLDELGYDAIEIRVDFNGRCPQVRKADRQYTIETPEGVKQLQDDAREAGKSISAFCLVNEFDARPNEEIAFTSKVAEIAADMKIPAVRLDMVPHKHQGDAYLKLAIDAGRRIVKLTEGLSVRFGLENHSNTTNNIEFLRKLFDGIGTKRFGLTLDTANFYWYGYPLSQLYDIFREYAPYVCHTHCKSIAYPEAEREKKRPMGWEYEKYTCPVDKGDIDFRKLTDILRKAGYTGDLCIENESFKKESVEQRKEILKKEAQFLRQYAYLNSRVRDGL